MTSAADPPRRRLVLKLIAAEWTVRGLLLVAAGIYLFFHLHTDFGKKADSIIRAVELDPRRHLLHRIVIYLHHLHASDLRIVALGALGYGALELVEGVGLWLDQLWAEYLTVVATSLLIPLEIYEPSATQHLEGRRTCRQHRDRRVPRLRAQAAPVTRPGAADSTSAAKTTYR